jgi:uncharacterized protein YciW
MLDYAVRLTVAPRAVQREDLNRLRASGFDDRGVSQLCLLTAWLNYLSRVADGLGGEPPST